MYPYHRLLVTRGPISLTVTALATSCSNISSKIHLRHPIVSCLASTCHSRRTYILYRCYVILTTQMSQISCPQMALAICICSSNSCAPYLVSQVTSKLSTSNSSSFSAFPHEASAPAFHSVGGYPLSSL